jgi:hypothetical protein
MALIRHSVSREFPGFRLSLCDMVRKDHLGKARLELPEAAALEGALADDDVAFELRDERRVAAVVAAGQLVDKPGVLPGFDPCELLLRRQRSGWRRRSVGRIGHRCTSSMGWDRGAGTDTHVPRQADPVKIFARHTPLPTLPVLPPAAILIP